MEMMEDGVGYSNLEARNNNAGSLRLAQVMMHMHIPSIQYLYITIKYLHQ